MAALSAEAVLALRFEAMSKQKNAPQFITERIGELALAGDVVGMERFRCLAKRIEQMLFAL